LAAQSSAGEVAFDQKRVLNRLDVLSRMAEELGQISAAARCEELIGMPRCFPISDIRGQGLGFAHQEYTGSFWLMKLPR